MVRKGILDQVNLNQKTHLEFELSSLLSFRQIRQNKSNFGESH
jgi:anthranilate/para-aminobenzoate synthase component I